MIRSTFSKMSKKEYWNAKNTISFIAFLIFAVQLLFIIYINLFCCHKWIDHDASMLYSHTIEMFKNKSFVLNNYLEETFLHIDTACILAMPLYGITKDIFLAYGIANVIFVLLTLYVLNDLIDKFDVENVYKYIAFVLYLAPYRIGMLEWSTMLFFECSFYNFCVLVPVMLIDLMLDGKCDGKNTDDKKLCTIDFIGKVYVKDVSLFAIYAIMTFITAFSRGTYVFLVGLLPVICCYVLEVVLSKDGLKTIKKSKVFLIISTVIVYALGMGLSAILDKAPNTDGYNLVLPHDLVNNTLKAFWGHLSIFVGPVSPDVMSADGIKTLLMLAFGIVTFILVIINLKHAFKEEEHSNELRYLTIVYVFNFCICALTQCAESDVAFPERYLFPGFLPVLMSVPIVIKYVLKIERDLLKKCVYFVLGCLTFCAVLIGDIDVVEGFKENADRTMGIRQTLSEAKANGINTVFFLEDDNAGLISRSLEPDMKVAPLWITQDGKMLIKAREFWMSARDRAYYDDKNMLAVAWNDNIGEKLPEYLRSSYIFYKDIEDYHLYISGENKFDERVGFPLFDGILSSNIDFAYSDGYTTIGDIDLYGYLEVTGNDDYVLISPCFDAPKGAVDVAVNYEAGLKTKGSYEGDEDGISVSHDGNDGVLGSLVLLDTNLNVVASSDMNASDNASVVSYESLAPCFVAIKANAGDEITIHNITFAAK